MDIRYFNGTEVNQTMYDILQIWNDAEGNGGAAKREAVRQFRDFIARHATTGDCYDLLRAMSNKDIVRART